jgi:hypothetical protein
MTIHVRSLLFAAAIAGAAQAPTTPTVGDAAQRLQSGDAAAAVRMLEAITAATPRNGRAWRVLGTAYQQLKDYDKAVAALKTALDVEPAMPMPLYTLGVVLAQKGDRDGAFEWLAKAKATRRIDMTQLEVDGNVTALKGDARFAALLPTAHDFANPFVEPVKIIREFAGEASNDQFGWIARDLGDVDADGIHDFAASAPTSGAAGKNAGRIYVYSAKSGSLLWRADGAEEGQLGTGIEHAGDTNRDGIPDVVASAPGSGKTFVYSGRDGKVLLTLNAEKPVDSFGRHVDGVGDVNGDGYADVIVGAPDNAAGGKGAGRAYVYSGKDGDRAADADGRTRRRRLWRGRVRLQRCEAPADHRRRWERWSETHWPRVRLHVADREAGVHDRV